MDTVEIIYRLIVFLHFWQCLYAIEFYFDFNSYSVLNGIFFVCSEGEETVGSSFSKVSINNIDGDIAGLRKKRPQFNPALSKKGVGQWERHTKGIGAKLLLQVILCNNFNKMQISVHCKIIYNDLN